VSNVIIKWKGRIHGEGRKMGVRGLWLFVSMWWWVLYCSAAVRRGEERRKE
jgi:hypothetical protein